MAQSDRKKTLTILRVTIPLGLLVALIAGVVTYMFFHNRAAAAAAQKEFAKQKASSDAYAAAAQARQAFFGTE